MHTVECVEVRAQSLIIQLSLHHAAPENRGLSKARSIAYRAIASAPSEFPMIGKQTPLCYRRPHSFYRTPNLLRGDFGGRLTLTERLTGRPLASSQDATAR